MNLTNLVLLSSTLLTNQQSAVTGRTNNAALLSHVEQVQRVDVTAWKSGRRIIARQTNVFNLPQRRWSEVVPDLSGSQVAAPAPGPSPAVTTAPVAPQNLKVAPAVSPAPVRSGPNTNSPAFRRRQEIEARRNAARTNQPALKP